AIEFPAGVELHILCDRSYGESRCHGLLAEASALLALIAKTVEGHAESRAAELGQRMNGAINALVKKGTMYERRNAAAEAWTENTRLLDRFFARLDLETLSASDLCFFPSRIVGSNRCSRLFFFHHAPNNTFSMRLHPLASQRSSRGSNHLDMAAEGIWRFDD